MSEKESCAAEATIGWPRGEVPASRVISLKDARQVRAHVDGHAVHDGSTVLVGWIFDPEHQVIGFARLVGPTGLADKKYAVYALEPDSDKVRISRVDRPDVAQALGVVGKANEQFGFTLVLRGVLADGVLALQLKSGRYAVLPIETRPMNVDALQASSRPLEHLETLTRSLPTRVEDPTGVHAAIDRVYPLGAAGMLVFGWMFQSCESPVVITLHGEKDETERIDGAIIRLVREDVRQTYRDLFPDLQSRLGFVFHARLPTNCGDQRTLRLDLGAQRETWLKLPTGVPTLPGIAQIKDILDLVPEPGRMREDLYALFEKVLGPVVETISAGRAPFEGPVLEREFGLQVTNPRVSVIVPLYGRFDFIRHQLAQFVNDSDFAEVELIYVLDDPALVSPTLEFAAYHHALFEVPLKLIWYNQNRGFAGANNIGVRHARGEYLVLLNSDVIPQRPGWIRTLRSALDSLPEAGAVGPLLQFGDDSIQHAGMEPRRDPGLPGFLLNAHPGKGQVWRGPDVPSEHPLLTAACLMLKKSDYLSVGGFDEGYLIGDFEDSDLSLALRKQGRRLYLVPEARLWHLERQSQNLGNIAGYRQMITLYNGWRYHKKVQNGQIADPHSLR